MKHKNARAAIEEYLGHSVSSVLSHRDPHNPDFISLRAHKSGKNFDFLLDTSVNGFDDENLEECEFETWPPKSDEKNMFGLVNVKVQ